MSPRSTTRRGTPGGRTAGGTRPPRRRLPAGLRGALAVTVVVLLVLVAWQRPNPFADPQTVRVAFRDAGGLRSGSEVRVSGTDAGEVSDVRRDGDHVVATLELHDDVGPVRRDASAALWPRLIFEGNAYVELQPGSADEPELGDRTVALGRTTSYVPLDRVLRLADAPTRGSIRRIARGLQAASDRRTSRAASVTLRRTPELLGSTTRVARAVGGGALTRAVDGMARTGDAIADHEADLVPVLRHASRTADALHAADGAALRATVRALPGTLAALRTGTARADRTLRAVDAFADDARPALRDLAPTIDDARPVIRRAGRVAVQAGPLAASLRSTLIRAAALAPEARGLVRDAAPTVATLDGSLLPALAKPTPTLKLPSYLAFLNMFAGGGGASRAFQRPSDSPLQQGDGHFMRFGIRFLTGIGIPVPACGDVETLSPPLKGLLASLELCTP
ncbi:MlaD family protein [Patulibacter sp.]|uniref:MlaD family protein n=1 Tax=Patulibacter sp. TaxID=1912859 RepID=UPI0027165F86|nr:MlaD family protein [Patulibacter sp.]MDO9409652.1 MlaD family protein [Patulibacter sp.]